MANWKVKPQQHLFHHQNCPQLAVSLLAIGGILLCGFVYAGESSPVRGSPGTQPAPKTTMASTHKSPQSYKDLLRMSPDELTKVDIALMNLLCAKGLPGSEHIDIPACLETLDLWAAQVGAKTAEYMPRFIRNPANYENSEGYFRMLVMITVLQLDLGVKYNLQKLQSPDFKDSRDIFIHGLLGYGDGGTCVSMPPLYVAVGRRLGYPIKLVFAKEHVFCRWEGQGERFNIEATSPGLNTFTDDYYKKQPRPLTQEELSQGVYLKTLTDAEALSDFMTSRGHCLRDNGRLAEARDAHRAASQLMPNHPGYKINTIATNLELQGYKGFRISKLKPTTAPSGRKPWKRK